jgi:hypothetical protein
VIYKTYPVYLYGREPDGYYEKLKKLDPEITFDADALVTEEDWIKAGELVYDWGLGVNNFDLDNLKKISSYHEKFNMPVTKEGIIPFFKITIREKNKLELTGRSCNTCHTKVMPDGDILKGGQGNYPFDQVFGQRLNDRMNNPSIPDSIKSDDTKYAGMGLFNAPWLETEAQLRMRNMSSEDFINTLLNTYGGVMHRHGTLIGTPVSVPDLFNLEERKYLDHTGLVRNNSIEDIMLYATLNESSDSFDKYGEYNLGAPWPSEDERMYQFFNRYSDAQLYALANFLLSLESPKNPNTFSEELLNKGERIFIEQGCVTCHTPPYYTNNKLLPVNGFEVPDSHKNLYDIFDVSVETDPTLALETRRGTGYYKVPSLVGVWNRHALLHDGSIRSLENLFDASRLEDDYETHGFKPSWRPKGPIEGHPFGLELNSTDKEAIMAYLNSL